MLKKGKPHISMKNIKKYYSKIYSSIGFLTKSININELLR
jgi:hypothetical protein